MRDGAAFGLRAAGWRGVLVAALVAIGLAVRLSAFADQGGRLLQMFPTEDGYLMLQVARNLALGHGPSTAAGTIPTNGVQPLATLLWAGVYGLAGGDKTAGVAGVLALELALSVLAAFLILKLGNRLFGDRPAVAPAAPLAAAAWLASPVAVPHTMNCLESSLYVVAILAAMLVFLGGRRALERPWPWRRTLFLGALLGLVFWARNDGVFVVGAVTLAHLLGDLRAAAPLPRRRFAESLVMGTTSIAVASPWLLFNQVRFGSVMPVSGQSEALHVELAHALHRLPPVLVELAGVVFPIPNALERRLPVALGCALLLVVAAAFALPRLWRSATRCERRLVSVVGIYGLCLLVFYGFFFGASHFMARYLFPLSPFFALLGARAALTAWRAASARGITTPALGAVLGIVILLVAAHVRFYRRALPHQHFQVVRWVEEHVPEETWVAAIQTGTLGYFHDHTINLDGKVNPEALRARAERRIPAYVIEKDVRYLADWVGIARWVDYYPDIRSHFEITVEDPVRNLAVLRRVGD